MAGTADQADDAVALDVAEAADQIESLLSDDEEGDEGKARQSKQGADQEEAEEQDEQQPAQATYTVKIGGKETQVTADELVKGYQRNADYTTKTQQLAAQRREQQAEFEAVRQERAKYGQLLQ